MMKKAVSAMLVTIVLFCGITAFAASEVSYHLDELGLTVSVPSDIFVFTRDFDSDDPRLAQFGLTKEQIDSIMESGNIYLNGIAEDVPFEVAVTMANATFNDLSYFSDEELSFLAALIEAEGNDNNEIDLIKYEVFNHPQEKFLKLYAIQSYEGITTCILRYVEIPGVSSRPYYTADTRQGVAVEYLPEAKPA